jgi:hypothetical protein
LLLVLGAAAALVVPSPSAASPYVRFGIQDDAWLSYGPGTLQERLDRVEALGVDVVRVTVDWRSVEPHRAKFDWQRYDELLNGLHAHGIAPLVTLYGTPAWANGGRGENRVPSSASTFATFAATVAKRYPFVHLWAIWNEPNQVRWLRPTSPRVYSQTLLNPAYAAIKRVSPLSLVAGGVTAPRGSAGGVSPVEWIRGMAAAHAKLDAYAHNPYPLAPGETPTSGGCGHCTTITMATLPRLLAEVQRELGTHVRIWLTEYGYQTNPPDRTVGVSYARQAAFGSEAALRAYQAPRVDILIHYLVQDEPDAARWQSGLFTVRDIAKPAYNAFRFPLAQLSRSGSTTRVWGQIRPGGRNRYVLQQRRGSRWSAVGGVRTTTARGYLTRTLQARKGSHLRLWIPALHTYSATVTVT